MVPRVSIIRLVCAVVLCNALALAQQKTADLILHNGKVLTVDANMSTGQAIAVTGNTITAVGNEADVMKLAGPNTQVIDLKGRTVMPGLIDTHRHIDGEAISSYGGKLEPAELKVFPLDWRGINTKDDLLNQIKGTMAKYKFKPGEWVRFENAGQPAKGINQGKILYDEINSHELDKVAPDNPIILGMLTPDHNGLLVNGKAMEILFKEHGDFIKKNGRYWIDSNGQPDGHFESPATRLIIGYESRPTPETLAPPFRKTLDELSSMGITTLSVRFPAHAVAAYKKLESEGQLNLRLAYGEEDDFGRVTDVATGAKALKGKIGTGTDKVWIVSIAPSSVDGSSSRSCMSMQRATQYGAISDYWPMGQCYYDNEFRGAINRGGPIQTNYFRDWTFAAAQNGLRFANTHVAGERTVTLLLNIVDQIHKQLGPNSTKNWEFDHCTFVAPADVPRAAKLGIGFSCAPKYIADGTAAAAEKSYGEKVANTYMVPLKSMVNAGIKPVFETDRDSYDWVDLGDALTRKDEKTGKVYGAQDKLDHATTLKMATRWGGDYVLRGDKMGSLEAGKLADLIVLDKDFMTTPEEEIATIQPQLTVVDGKIVFVHTKFSQEYNLKPAGAVISTYADLKARRVPASGAAVTGF